MTAPRLSKPKVRRMSLIDPSSFRLCFKLLLQRGSVYRDGRAISFEANRVESRDYARKCFAMMMIAAFPGDTVGEIAEGAARACGVSKRQAENWLHGTSSPAFEHVLVVGTCIGIWKTMEIMTLGGRSREDVAGMIGQRRGAARQIGSRQSIGQTGGQTAGGRRA